ncbi:MAG: hypothetical protein M3Z04_25380 [Chloroflexota bacterium]|nr:hypothetical protein [Chloroflexota bacterium]
MPYPVVGNYARPLLDRSPASANGVALTWAVSFAAFFLAYRRCPRVPDRRYLLVLGGAAVVARRRRSDVPLSESMVP